MLLYIEKKLLDNNITKNILSLNKNSEILLIDNYKNIFDKPIAWSIEKSLIIWSVNNAIMEAPDLYWHNWWGFFLKNSLNCIYDCSYCYLKWAFKNDIPVLFVNYDDIKVQILNTIKKFRITNKNDTIRFYSSDYSDNLATDNLSKFCDEFIPFFDTLDNVKMEIRTKSANINSLLKLKPSKNTEIAFSLNPEEIINKYELKTVSLDLRIACINKLLDKWWNVWIRFLPLLEVNDYKNIHISFLEYITSKINFNLIYSVFISWLLYTKKDYNKILEKKPYLDILYKIEDSNDWFVREKREVRDFFYNLFDEYINVKCNRCLDD